MYHSQVKCTFWGLSPHSPDRPGTRDLSTSACGVLGWTGKCHHIQIHVCAFKLQISIFRRETSTRSRIKSVSKHQEEPADISVCSSTSLVLRWRRPGSGHYQHFTDRRTPGFNWCPRSHSWQVAKRQGRRQTPALICGYHAQGIF